MKTIQSILRAAVVVLISGSVSCGLFETREPFAPVPTDQNCRPLTSAVNVRLNIVDAYGETSLQTCYSSLLDPTFRFHPDPQDSGQNPDVYIAWDDSVEAAHSSALGSLQEFIQVALVKTDQIISPDQTTETHFCDYQVRVRLEGDTTIARYTGKADLTFRRGSNGDWKIVDWADHRGSVSDSTWGLLRGTQRPGGTP